VPRTQIQPNRTDISSSFGDILPRRRDDHFSTFGLKYDTVNVFGDPNFYKINDNLAICSTICEMMNLE